MGPFRFFHSCWLLWAAALVIHPSFLAGDRQRLIGSAFGCHFWGNLRSHAMLFFLCNTA
jgi:hypothetical protein